jgi:hypothetical protein
MKGAFRSRQASMQALSMFGGTDDIIERVTGEAPLTVQAFIAPSQRRFFRGLMRFGGGCP